MIMDIYFKAKAWILGKKRIPGLCRVACWHSELLLCIWMLIRTKKNMPAFHHVKPVEPCDVLAMWCVCLYDYSIHVSLGTCMLCLAFVCRHACTSAKLFSSGKSCCVFVCVRMWVGVGARACVCVFFFFLLWILTEASKQAQGPYQSLNPAPLIMRRK